VRDRLVARLDEVEAAREALLQELAAFGEAVGFNRQMLLEGCGISDIFRDGPGPAARRQVRDAWSRLNEALHAYRAEAVRTLIDDDGWTLTAAARLTGNARQVVSRLYHDAGPTPESVVDGHG
jgi:hypothetical protein